MQPAAISDGKGAPQAAQGWPTPEQARLQLLSLGRPTAQQRAACAAAAALLEEALRIGRELGDELIVAAFLAKLGQFTAGPALYGLPRSPRDGHLDRPRPASEGEDQGDRPQLTPREAEILALLAQGLTNKAIAARLVLSVPTIQTHVANLYAKIGVHSRSAATAYALTPGFLFNNPSRGTGLAVR